MCSGKFRTYGPSQCKSNSFDLSLCHQKARHQLNSYVLQGRGKTELNPSYYSTNHMNHRSSLNVPLLKTILPHLKKWDSSLFSSSLQKYSTIFSPNSLKSFCECQNHSIHSSQGVNRQGIKRQ